jgi:uncharacterized RDD family membrane protein YckC
MRTRSRRVFAEERVPRFVGYAGFVSRTMAMLIDLVLLSAIWVFGGIALDFLRRTTGIDALLSLLGGMLSWIAVLDRVALDIFFELSSLLLLNFLYFTFFYSFGGVSIGKYLLGLRVVRSDGRPLRVPQAALRTLFYAPSTLLLYAGFLNVLFDDRRRGWHDILAGTVVVHSWREYPDGAPTEH